VYGEGERKRILKEIWCTRNVRFVMFQYKIFMKLKIIKVILGLFLYKKPNINFRKYLIFVFINIIIFITVTNAHNYSSDMDEFLV